MLKNFIDKSEDKRFRTHFSQKINTFYSNIFHYVAITKDLSYPYEQGKNGRALEKYEELVIEIKKQTGKIREIYDDDSISFFANVLYSETILMNNVNLAISKKVPMEHEVIKESMNEILIGLQKAFNQHCNINTNLLKEELYVSKTLRLRQEESRSELLKGVSKQD